MEVKIAPSILSADFGKLQEEVDAIENAGADWVHVDVMDGHFVPNLTFGAPVLKCIKTPLFKDVHLMISEPEKFLEDFVKAGADMLVVHAQVCEGKLPEVIDKIHCLGVKAGVALNPDKDLSLIEGVIDKVDMVLLMTVYPGFGGQKFMPEVLGKVSELRHRKPELDIQVDGGIDGETVKLAREAGANVFVAGSYVFGGEGVSGYKKRIDSLRKG